MALEALDGKIVFSEGSGGICGSFELLELWPERIGVLAKIGIQRFLVDFWSV
jgi:hypothetical protein